MDSFSLQVNGTPDSQNLKYIQVLGLHLGFPPEAVDYFLIAGFRMYDRVGLHYMDIHLRRFDRANSLDDGFASREPF
jgi:hypothetical protein